MMLSDLKNLQFSLYWQNGKNCPDNKDENMLHLKEKVQISHLCNFLKEL